MRVGVPAAHVGAMKSMLFLDTPQNAVVSSVPNPDLQPDRDFHPYLGSAKKEEL